MPIDPSTFDSYYYIPNHDCCKNPHALCQRCEGLKLLDAATGHGPFAENPGSGKPIHNCGDSEPEFDRHDTIPLLNYLSDDPDETEPAPLTKNQEFSGDFDPYDTIPVLNHLSDD